MPNDLCLRGEGTTALSLAVRMGAPLSVVHVLVETNIHQLGITHRLRGSILHDALKHTNYYGMLQGSNDESGSSSSSSSSSNRGSVDEEYNVFTYLLHRSIEYQESVLDRDSHLYTCKRRQTPEFRKVAVQNSRCLGGSGPDLLGVQDDLGRTILHCLVEHLKRRHDSTEQQHSVLENIRIVLEACQQALHVANSDGNTPLLSLLQLMPYHDLQGDNANNEYVSAMEQDINQAVELIVSLNPDAVTVARKMPRPWRFHGALVASALSATTQQQQRRLPQCSSTAAASPSDVSLTPLYYALLHGRSPETVQLLLRATHQVGKQGSSRNLVSPHQEVCLHVAVTTRALPSVIRQVLEDAPDAVLLPDLCGLSSVDWLWIRHVIDMFSDSTDLWTSRVISRRRVLPNQYPEWHKSAIDSKYMKATHQEKSTSEVSSQNKANLLQNLYQRMKVLLPQAAKEYAKTSSFDAARNDQPWSLLHSVCFVPGSIGLVLVALAMDPDAQRDLRTRDQYRGRYPLHYAAERCMAYSPCLPIGISPKLETVRETMTSVEEILPLYPEASQVPDNDGQLPLHIAIDSAKEYRQRARQSDQSSSHAEGTESNDSTCFELSALNRLLSHYPCAITIPDGKTHLFPWLQAAVGDGASLDVIYSLLHREPTLLIPKE